MFRKYFLSSSNECKSGRYGRKCALDCREIAATALESASVARLMDTTQVFKSFSPFSRWDEGHWLHPAVYRLQRSCLRSFDDAQGRFVRKASPRSFLQATKTAKVDQWEPLVSWATPARNAPLERPARTACFNPQPAGCGSRRGRKSRPGPAPAAGRPRAQNWAGLRRCREWRR